MRTNPYYYLRITQKLSVEIKKAHGEYEIDSSGKVTAYIGQNGVICNPVEITVKKMQDESGKSVLELEIPNTPGEPDNIELLSLDKSEKFEVWVPGFEKCRFEFEYTQKNNRHFLHVRSLELGYNAGKKNIKNKGKGKEKISVSKEGELGVEEKDSHDLKFEYEIKERDDDLKLIIELPHNDELELSFGNPKDFNVWDEELQLYFPLTFTYTQTNDKFYLEISQRASSVDFEITDEESVFRVDTNNKHGLQTVHPIEIALTQLKLNSDNTTRMDRVWDDTLRRELPFTFNYIQKNNKSYLKISQRASTARELTEFCERITNRTSGVSIDINEKGELVAGKGVSHPLKFNLVGREDGTIALICNGESFPLKCDGKPKDHEVWDQKLQRNIPLTFNFFSINK